MHCCALIAVSTEEQFDFNADEVVDFAENDIDQLFQEELLEAAQTKQQPAKPTSVTGRAISNGAGPSNPAEVGTSAGSNSTAVINSGTKRQAQASNSAAPANQRRRVAPADEEQAAGTSILKLYKEARAREISLSDQLAAVKEKLHEAQTELLKKENQLRQQSTELNRVKDRNRVLENIVQRNTAPADALPGIGPRGMPRHAFNHWH